MAEHLLGYDVGSSSIKATLLEAATGTVVASAVSPERELPIQAPRPGWAEQDPETWWEHVQPRRAARARRATGARHATDGGRDPTHHCRSPRAGRAAVGRRGPAHRHRATGARRATDGRGGPAHRGRSPRAGRAAGM